MKWRFGRARRVPSGITRGRSLVAARGVAAALLFGSMACGGNASGPPRVATVTIAPSPANVALGATLQLNATPKDASGNTVAGVTATWRSANANIAPVSQSGLVSGNLVGTTQVTASFNGAESSVNVTVAPPPVFSVTIEPGTPNVSVGGTIQLQATLRDASNNVLSGRAVTWLSLNQTVATVDGGGLARGVTAGTAQISATSEGVTGTTTISVGAVMAITAVSPNPLSAGATATITGSGFSATPQSNTVTVGGFPATVSAATATSLTVTLPGLMCLPTGNVAVQVAVAGGGNAVVNHPFLTSAPPFTVAVGQQVILSTPASFCLQFAGGAATESYAIGVQSVSEIPSSLTPALVRGAIPASASPAEPVASLAALAARTAQGAAGGNLNQARMRMRERHQRAELDIRAQERALRLTQPAPSADAMLSAASMAVPANTRLGDTLDIRVPNRNSVCTNPIPIRAVVRHVGTRAFFLEDVQNPAGGFTAADFQSFGALLDNQVWTTNTAYFGTPTDRDANSRIVIIVTKEINRFANILGFVSSGDFLPAQCAASNNGEYYYGFAPDPTGIYALEDATLDNSRYEWPLLIAHEFTHIIQFGRRLQDMPTAPPLSVWQTEGQATLAEEVVGHAVLGRQSRQNYGIDVVLDSDSTQVNDWYFAPFLDLFVYYGYNGTQSKTPNAPEECGWLTNVLADVGPCPGGRSVYGVSWSFLRWLTDQFSPTFPGGEQGLQRAMIANPNTGFDNIASLVGEPMDRLLSQWSATLHMDDRVAGLNARLSMASWNLFEMDSRLITTVRLIPRARTFGNFADNISMRAGSTAYFRVGGSNRPPTAISVTSPSGGTLPGTTRVWVVRVQ